MDNTIPPITSINLNLSGSDKVVNGEIEGLPSTDIVGIKTGDNLLLKALLSQNASLSDSVVSSLKVSLTQTNNAQTAEIKLDTPLRLPDKAENQIAVKVQNISPEKIEVKLVSINNEPPAKFIAPSQLPLQTEKTQISQQTSVRPFIGENKSVQLPVASEKTLIVETGAAAKNVVFHELKLPQVIENIAKPLDLPKDILSQITDTFQGAKITVGLNNFVVKQDLPQKTLEAGFGNISQPVVEEQVQNVIERLRPVLNNFAEQITSTKAQPEQLRQLAVQIKNEVLPLQGQSFSGEAVSQPDNRVLVFKTALGNVLPESPLKAETGTQAVLEIKNVSFPETVAQSPLESLISSVRLIEEATGLPPLVSSGNKPEVLPAGHNIASLIEPLKTPKLQNLSNEIIAKLPAVNDKMLANTVNFIKGAVTRNLEAWLGKETVKELNASGIEGQEVAARLENLMNASVRDGVSWRIVDIPLFSGEGMSKIRIAVKKNGDEDKNKQQTGKNSGGTRFVVDTSFSRLGDFQFDGFSLVKDRRFDLVIRTSKEVGDDLYANILRLFKTTLNDLEYSGNIKINVKENFIKICENNQYGETLKDGIYI